jgi:soluble lytic murein transglycosylase-like protein
LGKRKAVISKIKWIIPLVLILTPTLAIAEPNTEQIANNINRVIEDNREPLRPFPIGNIPIVEKEVKTQPASFKVVKTIDNNVVQQVIVKWAIFYGVDQNKMLRIARCESGYRPNASNGTHFGIFQFLPSTFYANAGYMKTRGLIDKNLTYDYWNYEHNIQVATWMFSIGQQGQWQCK